MRKRAKAFGHAPVALPDEVAMPLGYEEFGRWYRALGPGSGHGSTREYTRAFRAFLEDFLRKYGIRSVLDYGCGDWRWAREVDWGGASYHGVDVVPWLVQELTASYGRDGRSFELIDPDAYVAPEVDLVLCKDVLQHLPTAEIKARLDELVPKAKHLLLVNDLGPLNGDVRRGGYRPLDLNAYPFELGGRQVFEFHGHADRKIALHLTGMRRLVWPGPHGASQLVACRHELKLPTDVVGRDWPHNPSVVVHHGSLLVSVRILDPKTSTSRNALARVGDDGGILDFRLVRELDACPKRHAPLTRGFEDIRLFVRGGRLMGSATTCDRSGTADPQIAILCFDNDGDVVEAYVQSSFVPEKNWMPCVREGGAVDFVYRVEPTVIVGYHDQAHTVSTSVSDMGTVGRLRGGSQLIPYDDGYVAVVHERRGTDVSSGEALYLHRFALFSAALDLIKTSEPFYFERHGIEFCAGMAAWEDGYVLSYGVADRKACLAYVEATTVKEMLA